MRKINITTTQNVTINYQLASVWQRVLAWLLDYVIICLGIVILSVLYQFVFLGAGQGYLQFLIITPIYFLYHFVSEVVSGGRSIGKMAAGIGVIKLTGREPTISDYFTRWAFRLIDLGVSFGSLAFIFINTSEKSQRLGDLLAQTIVVKVKPSLQVQLKDILNIETAKNYSPVYPNIKKFSEKDMLLIKYTLERYHKYPNKSHLEALDLLTLKMKNELEISNTKQSNMEFLRTLVKDYIVLTR